MSPALITAAAVSAVIVLIAVAVLSLRALRGRRFWRAWQQIDTLPEQALPVLEAMAGRWHASLQKRRDVKKPAYARLAQTTLQAWVGVALCQIHLGRFDQAAQAETRARGLGHLPVEFLSRLCAAWLKAKPVLLAEAAMQDLFDYAGLPIEQQGAEIRDAVLAALRARIELPENAPPERIDQAVKLGQRLLAAAPGLDWPKYLLGLALQAAGRWSDSLPMLEQAVAAAPDQPERRQALAQSQWQTGARQAARVSFLTIHRQKKLASTAYDAALVCQRLADVPFTTDDGPELKGVDPLKHAETLLREATVKAPEQAEFWQARGRIEMQLEHFEAAQNSLEQAALLEPGRFAVEAMLARCRLARGDVAGATQALPALQKTAPDDAFVCHLAGDLAFLAGDYRAALAYYRRVIPPSDEALFVYRQARCELEIGNSQAGIELLRNVKNLSPDARLTLGRCYARQGRWSEALHVLEAGADAQSSAEYRYYLASALAANSHYERAEQLFREVSQFPDWRSRARRQRGHMHVLCGDHDGAERLYKPENGAPPAHFDLGRVALLRGDYDAARQSFDEAAAVDAGRGDGDGRGVLFARSLLAAHLGDAESLRDLSSDPHLGRFAQESLADAEFEQGRYKQAVILYEQAIRERSHVSTVVLTRLATSYLHQNRFREALPPLVEVARRSPKEQSVRENLAYCRFQLGREYYRQAQPDAAQLQFARAREILAGLGSPLATAVGLWENEARFRVAAGLLTSRRARQPQRAADAFEEGAKLTPQDRRWWFGLGLARAELKQFEASAEAFARGAECVPQSAPAFLGRGLSLQSADRSAEARDAFGKVLELIGANAGEDARNEFLSLATRFAIAMSHAKDGQWQQAAVTSVGLIDHPLIQKSSRVSERDVAQTAIACYALAGMKEQASKLAKKHLQGQALGDVLIGIVQAEAGDYAGAARTLASAVASEPSPRIKQLLADCLLAAAADIVRQGQFAQATTLVEEALRHVPGHKLGKELQSALGMALRLGKLDLEAIDSAISDCRGMLSAEAPAQLVRTLGVLLHRKAFQAERKGSDAVRAWQESNEFWNSRILSQPAFWTKFRDEYNAGKDKRESVSNDDLDRLQKEFPGVQGARHLAAAAHFIRSRDESGAQRLLKQIWESAPEYELDDKWMNDLTGNADASTEQFLERILGGLSSCAGAYSSFGLRVARLINMRAVQGLQPIMSDLASASQQGQAAIVMALIRRRTELRAIRSRLNTARQIATQLRSKAPGNTAIREFFNTVEQNCKEVNPLCDLLDRFGQ